MSALHRQPVARRAPAAPAALAALSLVAWVSLQGAWAQQSPPAAPPPPVAGGTARPAADDPALEARMLDIAAELRCVVCQNQTVADSHAELAADLREQIRSQLRAGRTPDEIRGFMTDRYGDFVLYRPPFNTRTALLWAGPALLMATGVASLLLVLRRRQRLPDDAFDPDPSELPDERPDAPTDAPTDVPPDERPDVR